MSARFGSLIKKILPCLLLVFLVIGSQIGNCQESAPPGSIYQAIRVYIRKAEEECHKDIVGPSRDELLRTKNLSKDDIKFIAVQRTSDGWHVLFSVKGFPPGCLATMYVSKDKKTFKHITTSR